nr:substrate-binding domain-containing protein [Burkholderia cenocepacia]
MGPVPRRRLPLPAHRDRALRRRRHHRRLRRPGRGRRARRLAAADRRDRIVVRGPDAVPGWRPIYCDGQPEARVARVHAPDRRRARAFRDVQPAGRAGEPLGAAARAGVRPARARGRARRADLPRAVDQRVGLESRDRATDRLAACAAEAVGVIAVTDARARHLLQACLIAGLAVPEQVAIIGIDNDPLTRTLTRIPLSSVIQGTEEMGRTAAHLLHRMLRGARFPGQRILVPPVGINVLESTRHQPLASPHVMRARHFIRQYACQGIKTEQVADYVGVSRSLLEEHFRRELQRTVHQEILRHKLEAAQALLAGRQASSAEVAIRCGFTSLQYMYAVFRRELGCTPREYQERAAATP